MIEITLLGTAALLPLPERALTAAVLRCGGKTILFDCGEGTQTAARRAGVSLMGEDVMIALTHYHGDHLFGLPGLLQTMGVFGRTTPLVITGPEGIGEALAPILRLAGALPFEVRLTQLPGEGARLCDLLPGWTKEACLTPIKTSHRVVSQGYRFTLGRAGRFHREKAEALGVPTRDWGRLQRGESVEVKGVTVTPGEVLGPPRRGLAVVFSGDTAPCESLTEAARDADLLICEGTYGEDAQEAEAAKYGHMTFSQAARTARDAGVRRLWLTHYSQRIRDPMDYIENARRFFPEALCGTDGMGITLRFEEE